MREISTAYLKQVKEYRVEIIDTDDKFPADRVNKLLNGIRKNQKQQTNRQ